jgi:hypothetical protein
MKKALPDAAGPFCAGLSALLRLPKINAFLPKT